MFDHSFKLIVLLTLEWLRVEPVHHHRITWNQNIVMQILHQSQCKDSLVHLISCWRWRLMEKTHAVTRWFLCAWAAERLPLQRCAALHAWILYPFRVHIRFWFSTIYYSARSLRAVKSWMSIWVGECWRHVKCNETDWSRYEDHPIQTWSSVRMWAHEPSVRPCPSWLRVSLVSCCFLTLHHWNFVLLQNQTKNLFLPNLPFAFLNWTTSPCPFRAML